jgi:hypothetical protein
MSDENFAAKYKKAELATQQLQLKAPKAEWLYRRHCASAPDEHTPSPSAEHEFSAHHERIRAQYSEALDTLTAAAESRALISYLWLSSY